MYAPPLLSPSDHAFLDALRGGQSARGYALRNHYSADWAKWKSKDIRRRLGVQTIAEAIAMSEVSAEDVAALRKEIADLKEAQAKLAKATTPAAKEAAREDVKDARDDLDAELRRRGLTRDDLDGLQEEKEYGKFKAREERLRREREEEEARTAGATDPDEVAAPPAPKKKAKADAAPEEEKPESSHLVDRPLWGKKKADA